MKLNRLLLALLFCINCIAVTVCAQEQDSSKINNMSLVIDSSYYESLRDSAIMLFHREQLDSAQQLLAIYYPYHTSDSVTVNILTAAFLKQLNKETKPKVNFNQINAWIKTYPFVASNQKFRKIKIIESLKLSMAAFDSENFVLAETYYNTIQQELEKYSNKAEIIALPNLHTLIFNLALKRFYDKDYKKAVSLFKTGTSYYPNDPEMARLYNSAKERIAK